MTGPLQRREEILRLIRHQPVQSQDELLTLLRQRGFAVTQPTLSRDLRELGLVKTPFGYADPSSFGAAAAPVPFVPSEVREANLDALIGEAVTAVTLAGTLVVLKTPPAGAQPVARVLDEADLPGVAGTLAGDDTIFVALESARSAAALARRFTALIGAPAARRRRA